MPDVIGTTNGKADGFVHIKCPQAAPEAIEGNHRLAVLDFQAFELRAAMRKFESVRVAMSRSAGLASGCRRL